jgi:hypothetical protein
MTIGDKIREIKKQSLWNEIKNLEKEVGYILKNDGDATENDPDIQAYRKVIAEKKRELEYL